MPFASLPADARDAMDWSWSDYEHHYVDLKERPVNEDTLDRWLADWSQLANVRDEVGNRLYVATTVNTADKDAQQRFQNYMANIAEKAEAEEEILRRKLLESGLSRPEIAQPLQQIKADSESFCEANLPIQTKLMELTTQHDALMGERSIEWNGEEETLEQASLHLESTDRNEREKAWRLIHERILADRAKQNDLWQEMFGLREKLWQNAGKQNFIEYIWPQLHRFDYTPEDCASFRAAILSEVVPVATEIYEERRKSLGLDTLRPWDTNIDPLSDKPLRPYRDEGDLHAKTKAIYQQLDPALADRYQDMIDDGLLDLFSRKNKAGGGYCTGYAAAKKPFIFMNAVGSHDDIQTLLHECGHAFHVYESAELPYRMQTMVGSEFAEVASMGMEMLGQPLLGEYYDEAESARAQIQHLEKCILFWPYMAVVDGFQHWVYSNGQGSDPAACDAKWAELWDQFMPGIDFSGLEEIKKTGWHRKLHIFQIPFYYVEYGLAQVGAMQVWQNGQKDAAEALRKYRHALSLGCTVSLPQLFEAAGLKFAFDAETLGSLTRAAADRLAELRASVK